MLTAQVIGGPLPALEGTGWAREDVWSWPVGGGYGDYAVGRASSARYTYTLPCGTRRLCMDDDYFIEPDERNSEYVIINRYEVREERRVAEDEWEEVFALESGYDVGSVFGWETLESAEKECERLALADIRFCLFAYVKF